MEQPKLVKLEQVSDGWIKKYVMTFERANGRTIEYESVSRKGYDAYRAELERNATADSRGETDADGVCIVARTPRDSLLMIREFRYPLNSWCVSFPAGLIERGEQLFASVDRELREETGYALVPGSTPKALPQAGFSSTGMGDEAIQIVFAEAEHVGAQQLEPAELIEPFELPLADIEGFLSQNKLAISTRSQLILYLMESRYAAERKQA